MRRRLPLPSILRRTALLLALGLATTVLVSWTLAAFLPHSHLRMKFNVIQSTNSKGGLEYVSVLEFRRAGMIRRAWQSGRTGRPAAWTDLSKDALTQLGFHPQQDRSWGLLPGALALGGAAAGSGLEDARGWPFLALWCSFDAPAIDSATATRPVSGGLAISRRGVNTAQFRALPLMPIWSGFALDTAIFACAWGLAIPAFHSAKRACRRLRGQCPACAYNLKKDLTPGCPECGWNRPPGAAHSSSTLS
jgi:hypothetical protein